MPAERSPLHTCYAACGVFLSHSKVLLCLLASLLAACAQEPVIRDSAPSIDRAALMRLPDAVPRVEPVTRAGNPNPYTVLKKTYHLLPTSVGYHATGTASWYGTKFHGRNTANGERYDMNAMTAAHKTLPIPCYARVKNLRNQRSVVVRINDRGPFHGDRLIDLSYAAAVKLGFADEGTAPVEIEVLSPGLNIESASVPRPASKTPRTSVVSDTNSVLAVRPVNAPVKAVSVVPVVSNNALKVDKEPHWFLQAGAFLDQPTAENLREQLSYITSLPVAINASAEGDATVYRVRIGPSDKQQPLLKLQSEMRAVDLGKPFMVSDSQ